MDAKTELDAIADATSDELGQLEIALATLQSTRNSLRNEIVIEAENLAIMRANLRCVNDEIRAARKAIAKYRRR